MGLKLKFGLVIASLVAVVLVATLLLQGSNIAVLNPKGMIADQQRDLLVVATLLMLIVVIPVFVLTFAIAWKYRAGNKEAAYKPEWDHNSKLEFIWWTIPFIIIAVLSVITWISTHQLDPYRQLEHDKPPVRIKVVALEWKWLFIYPEQDIATVNYIKIPVNTPINFEITADAPMNSFWIPQLGGQVYAMNGMVTKLHLIANEAGRYQGSSANISGEGFADMRFIAEADSESDFQAWLKAVKRSGPKLDLAAYEELAAPSRVDSPIHYSSRQADLYDTIVMKYMMPPHEPKAEHAGHH